MGKAVRALLVGARAQFGWELGEILKTHGLIAVTHAEREVTDATQHARSRSGMVPPLVRNIAAKRGSYVLSGFLRDL